MKETKAEDFPIKSYDKLRYSDTDRQGHINNAIFSTFLETGRVEILYNPEKPVLKEGNSFVIASLKLDFKKEINWPGIVEIATGIVKIGNSSIVLYQRLFQKDICVASAETTIVHVNNNEKTSSPLSDEARKVLAKFLMDNCD